MDLDQPHRFAAVDAADALGDVEVTAAQWQDAADHGTPRLDTSAYDAVVISGMGGSGIAGDVVWALSLAGFQHPVVVHKGYGVPGFTGPRTLLVAFSYSGSTEETLSAFEEAGERGAGRFAVTTGGALAEQAALAGVPVALVPRSHRPPRHSLGSMLVPALVALGLDGGLQEAIEVLAATAGDLGRDIPTSRNPAKQVAARLGAGGVVPLLWGGHGLGSVAAYRLKCQLNENAKMPAFHVELPEGDHNEVVGYEQPSTLTGTAALIEVRDLPGEHPRVGRRFELSTRLLRGGVAFSAQLRSRGTGLLARAASLLVQADLVSVYTALAADRDPTPVASIDSLKRDLGRPASVR